MTRLNDGSAIHSSHSMEKFMEDLKSAVEGLKAEDDPEPTIETLVQVSNMRTFSLSQREQAEVWLALVESQVEVFAKKRLDSTLSDGDADADGDRSTRRSIRAFNKDNNGGTDGSSAVPDSGRKRNRSRRNGSVVDSADERSDSGRVSSGRTRPRRGRRRQTSEMESDGFEWDSVKSRRRGIPLRLPAGSLNSRGESIGNDVDGVLLEEWESDFADSEESNEGFPNRRKGVSYDRSDSAESDGRASDSDGGGDYIRSSTRQSKRGRRRTDLQGEDPATGSLEQLPKRRRGRGRAEDNGISKRGRGRAKGLTSTVTPEIGAVSNLKLKRGGSIRARGVRRSRGRGRGGTKPLPDDFLSSLEELQSGNPLDAGICHRRVENEKSKLNAFEMSKEVSIELGPLVPGAVLDDGRRIAILETNDMSCSEGNGKP